MNYKIIPDGVKRLEDHNGIKLQLQHFVKDGILHSVTYKEDGEQIFSEAEREIK